MKALILLKSGRGGVWAVQQARQLAEYGWKQSILLPAGPTAELAKGLPGVRVIQAGGPTDQSNLEVVGAWRSQVRRAIQESAADVVHSHFVATTIASRLSRVRCPVVFQVPGPLHLERAWSRAVDVWTSRPQDRWIAGCQATREHLIGAGIAPNRVSLAYYCGDSSRWENPVQPVPRAQLGIPVGRPLCGMVAFVYPPLRRFKGRGLKGHEDFIAAMRLLRQRGESVCGLVVGGAWPGAETYARTLRAAASRALPEALTWIDTVPDVLPYYATMDIAVHPSLSENLGGAAESMRSGVATIATRVGGFPDLIEHGVTGLLVQPGSPDQLADAIAELASDPIKRARLAEAGRRKAFELLDPLGNAERVDAALRAAIEGRNAPPD